MQSKANFHKTSIPNNINNIYDNSSIINLRNIKLYIIVCLSMLKKTFNNDVNLTCKED